MKSKSLRFVYKLGLLVLAIFIYSGDMAYADHSINKPCYGCHNLKSVKIIVGSRSIIAGKTRMTGVPNAYVSGGPFDCSFCHDTDDDVPQEFTVGNPGIPPTEESTHPVDVINDKDNVTNGEIVCADCHMAKTTGNLRDVAPAGLQTTDDDDGYPNHRSVKPGYSPYSSPDNEYPWDASNLAHLTRPYGYKQVATTGLVLSGPMPNRYVNWASTSTLGEEELLCFVCHGDLADLTTWTMTAQAADSTYNIKAEYNNPDNIFGGPGFDSAGHVMRSAGASGASNGDIQPGDRMPCFNCHDSHSAADELGGVYNAKLIRLRFNPYRTSSFQLNGTILDVDPKNGKIDDDRLICVECHETNEDTTQSVDSYNLTGNMRGITAVDPFTNNTPVNGIHECAGVNKNDIAASTVGCLSPDVTDQPGGCHMNAHNPVPTPISDAAKCYTCHGADCVSTIVRVNNGVLDPFGRGGDFGLETKNNKTQNTDDDIKSTHNITFSASSHGGDVGTARGVCTVCHTVAKRAGTNQSNHGDGDPRNDFRDVDPDTTDGNELQLAPMQAYDYRYYPEWMLCVDCHDDITETNNTNTPYWNIIGSNQVAPLNFDDGFIDRAVPPAGVNTGQEYAYGAGDWQELAYFDNPITDKTGTPAGGDDDNATPEKRYNGQPYKAHYYQTDGATYDVLWSNEVLFTSTNPLDEPAYSGADPNPLLRIINCLDCHYGHGGPHEKLYRSPDSTHDSLVHLTAGRALCLDCHKTTMSGGGDQVFPRGVVQIKDASAGPDAVRLMWGPPTTDRYGNQILIANGSDELGNPHLETDTVGNQVSCTNGGQHATEPAVFKCHNVHVPSCEACHMYPIQVGGDLDIP